MTLGRVAAVDVGTNTVRLLVADLTGDATTPLVRPVEREMVIARLGEGVDADRALRPAAIDRTIDAVAGFVHRARAAGASAILVAGTSAVRDAANRDEFASAVYAATGEPLHILDGDTEARLSFAGAASGIDVSAGALVCDIGGGSTELVAGDRDVRAAVSLNVGSVRLTERHVRSDPPSPADLGRVRSDAREALAAAATRLRPVLESLPAPMLVGVAGTVTTLTAFALALPRYEPARVHAARIAAPGVREAVAALAAMTSAERRALPVMPPGREDVIVAGGVLLLTVLESLGFDALVASEADILDGLVLRAFGAL